MIKQIFVNLPVSDLDKSMEFFANLGMKFDKKFTDNTAACMIIGKNIYAMLLTEKSFKGFINKKESVNAHKNTEVINALQVSGRKEVDELMKKAFSAGAIPANERYDLGWMYGHSFYDLDGHMWEVFHLDAKKRPKSKK